MLVLDGGADTDADDLDGQFEVVVDRQLGLRATRESASVEDVLNDLVSHILSAVVRGVDGEVKGGGGPFWEPYVGKAASTD